VGRGGEKWRREVIEEGRGWGDGHVSNKEGRDSEEGGWKLRGGSGGG